MNWRKGSLRLSSNLRSYAGCAASNKLVLQVPLIFFNTGAVPIVIENLRIKFEELPEDNKYLFFNAVSKSLASDEGRAFAKPFAVKSNDVVELVCEFQKENTSFKFEAKNYTFDMEMLEGCKAKWSTLKKYNLYIAENDLKTINSSYIAHDNQKI